MNDWDDESESWTPEPVAPPMLDDDGWGDDLVLPPLSTTTTITRNGTRIIVSRALPTLNNKQEENTIMSTTDYYADREGQDNIGLIQSWFSGHAPGSIHVPMEAVAQRMAIAKYGEQRGRLAINIRNATHALRKVIVQRAAKDDMTKMPEATVVLNTSEFVPPSVAWLNSDQQIRFFKLTDLDTSIPRVAGKDIEVVAVLFSPASFRDFQDGRTGEWMKIPSDWDPRAYVDLVGCWEHMTDAIDARDELEQAIRAQIAASRSAERPDGDDVEYDDDGERVTYFRPVDAFGHA